VYGLVCSAGPVALGDLVIFKNGDRLTGTIKSAADGKILIDTPFTGTVSADMAGIETFTTDQPITFELQNGNALKQRAVPTTQPGMVDLDGMGVVAIGGIRRINPESLAPAPGAPAPGAPPAPAPPPPVKWTGSVKAGAIVTRGNSDTENFNINFDASRRSEKHRFTTAAGYFFGRQRDPNTGTESTTTNNWFVMGKYDYFITPKFYAYAQTRVEQDQVAKLDLRVIPGVGLGYQWYDTPTFKFSTEGGLDWVYEQYETGGTNEHFAARAAYHVEKKLNETVTLFHDFEYLPSLHELNDFNINADAGIRTTLYKNLFSEFKVVWQFDSTPAPGASDSDFRYTLTIGFTF